jgi:teichuronic acid biosynthesis glycosyltransferase TuaH
VLLVRITMPSGYVQLQPEAPYQATRFLKMADPLEPAPAGDVVFCFSYLSWEAVARRGWFGTEDRLVRGLLENERVGRVLVCDQMRSLPVVVVRDLLRRVRRAGERDASGAFPTSPRAQLLRPVGVRREYPTSIGGVERMAGAVDRAVRRAAERMGLVEPAVIVAHPLLAGFAELEWAGRVTFFATDDWQAYEPQRRWWPAYEESFRRVGERGRSVAAVSEAALERIAPNGPSAVIPNGIDPGEWLGPAPAPEGGAQAGRPVLVYAGTLDSRLDVAGLRELARGMPDARLVLVGPLLDAPHLEGLRDSSNVEIRSAVGRAEVVALLRGADVGLVPHVDNALTRAMSPLKLYEYLAAGLPVVASDLAPMRGVDASVTVVTHGEGYAPAVEAALARGPASEEAREDFIARNSWRARHEKLLDLALA